MIIELYKTDNEAKRRYHDLADLNVSNTVAYCLHNTMDILKCINESVELIVFMYDYTDNDLSILLHKLAETLDLLDAEKVGYNILDTPARVLNSKFIELYMLQFVISSKLAFECKINNDDLSKYLKLYNELEPLLQNQFTEEIAQLFYNANEHINSYL